MAWTVLYRVHTMALLEVLGPKKAGAFIRRQAEMLASEEALAATFPLRPSKDNAAVAKARRGAVAVFKRYMPIFLSGVK
jgi:hypothetical protein